MEITVKRQDDLGSLISGRPILDGTSGTTISVVKPRLPVPTGRTNFNVGFGKRKMASSGNYSAGAYMTPPPKLARGNAKVGQKRVMMADKPPKSNSSVTASSKTMKLRCRVLHSFLLRGNLSEEMDADATFLCSNNVEIKAHKVILCGASKFFSDVLRDQVSGEMTFISVPDVPPDIMQKIVSVAYKDTIELSELQIRDIGLYMPLFGMTLTQFEFQSSPGNWYKFQTVLSSQSSPIVKAVPTSPKSGDKSGVKSVGIPFNNLEALLPGSNVFTINPISPKSNSKKSNDSMTGKRAMISNSVTITKMSPPNIGMGEVTPELNDFSSDFSHSQKAEDLKLLEDINNLHDDSIAMMDESDPCGQDYGMLPYPVDVQINDNTLGAEALCRSQRDSLFRRFSVVPDNGPKRSLSASEEFKKMMPGWNCSVCAMSFESQEKWKWHEDRHVAIGIFKCIHCDSIFKTALKVFDHEQMSHIDANLVYKPGERSVGSYSIKDGSGGEFDLSKSRKERLVPRKEFDEVMGKMEGTKEEKALKPFKKLMPSGACPRSVRQGGNRKVRDPNSDSVRLDCIEQGESDVELEKSKESGKAAHWILVCKKCETVSDTISKSLEHFNKCFEGSGYKFENTVYKYKLGTYGKYQCPVCYKRFVAVTGFQTHCVQQHPDYRRKFTTSHDGKLSCVSCKEMFPHSMEFHAHLVDGECDSLPKSATITSATLTAQPRKRPKLVTQKVSEDSNDQPYSRPQSSHILSSAPRSARLAKKAQKLAEKTEDKNFPPTACPVCGISQVESISQHLNAEHDDLQLLVTRIADDLVRCCKCSITFAICDLLTHNDSCTSDLNDSFKQPDGTVNSSPGKTGGPSRFKRPSSPMSEKPKEPWVRPNDVGKSKVEEMPSPEELFTAENYKKAFMCRFCGKKFKRISLAADCYRTHSVFRCSLCYNTYDSKESYSLHIRVCHGSLGSVSCPICQKVFKNMGQCSSHMYIQHWGKLAKPGTKSAEISPTAAAASPLSANANTPETTTDGEEGTLFETAKLEEESLETEANGEDSFAE